MLFRSGCIDVQDLYPIPTGHLVPVSTTICLRLVLGIRKTCHQPTVMSRFNEQVWNCGFGLGLEDIEGLNNWDLGLWGNDVASEGELQTLSAIY